MRLTFDLAAAFDPPFDEEARSESHVRLEGVDVGAVQSITQLRNIAGDARRDLNHRRAGERAFIDQLL